MKESIKLYKDNSSYRFNAKHIEKFKTLHNLFKN